MDTGMLPVKIGAFTRIVKSAGNHLENVKCVNLDFGERSVRMLVESVDQISVVKLMDDVNHANLDFMGETVQDFVIYIIVLPTHVVHLLDVINVNLDTGETSVNKNATKIAFHVTKAMEFVTVVVEDFGELIVRKRVIKVVPHTVIEPMERAVAADMDFGATFVMRLAGKAVNIHRAGKVMAIAVLVKINIGGKYVTRRAFIIV